MEFTKYNFGPELMSLNIGMDLCNELLSIGRNELLINEKVKSISFNSSFKYSSENVSYFKDKIFVFINNYINEVGNYRKLPNYNFKYHLEDLWINFQKTKDFNSPHFHSSDISFVIYVDIPEKIKSEVSIERGFKNGSISFMYGQNVKKNEPNNNKFLNVVNSFVSPITQISHLPSNGEMFIFPSYLTHYVSPFFSDGVERISVAGNVNLLDGDKKTII
jgi:hypothetical protein